VRRFSPQASGSGIPYVEAVLDRELTPASLLLLPVKFLGGLLAIGADLMLGREGPSVQMEANLGALLGKKFRMVKSDLLAVVAAGAGAGLAAAISVSQLFFGQFLDLTVVALPYTELKDISLGFCSNRHGVLFLCCCARTADGHHPGLGTDEFLQLKVPHAVGVFRGHVGDHTFK
jgi:hypothetical protein